VNLIITKSKLDKSLNNFIKEKIDSGDLYENNIILSAKIFEGSNNFKLYKSSNKLRKKITKQAKANKLKILDGEDTLVVLGQNNFSIIVFNWMGLNEIVKFYEKKFGKKKEFKKKIFLLEYDIRRCLTHLSECYKELTKKHPNVVTTDLGIEIYEKITVNNIYVSDGDNNLIKKIPKKDVLTINRVCIDTDPNGLIISVKLDIKHPNCDKNGYYCLGDNLLFKPLTSQSLKKILQQIKIMNLLNCYWVPNFVKKLGDFNES